MKINGQCHCGAIKINGNTDETNTIACHCTDCQIFSGAPFRAVVICKADDFNVLGSPKEYLKTADSGNKKIQAFCKECGSQLYATDLEKTIFNVRMGCLDQRDDLKPTRHIFGTSSRAWINKLTKDPWFTKGPNSDPMKIN